MKIELFENLFKKIEIYKYSIMNKEFGKFIKIFDLNNLKSISI